jgi:hypothetical protein
VELPKGKGGALDHKRRPFRIISGTPTERMNINHRFPSEWRNVARRFEMDSVIEIKPAAFAQFIPDKTQAILF